MTQFVIRGGRVIDPANQIDQVTSLYVRDGRIASIGAPPENWQPHHEVINASDKIVCPGLVDLCTRMGEPGSDFTGTIASETLAAAKGGMTTIVYPSAAGRNAIDKVAVVDLIQHRAQRAGNARVELISALTTELNGKNLSQVYSLQNSGCIATSNGEAVITDTQVMRRAMEYARSFGITIIVRPQDAWLADGGCAHEGEIATQLGLPGIPAAAETVALAQRLELVAQTGTRVHFTKISTSRGVDLLRQARASGLPVSADVSINQLHLTEADLAGFNSMCHVYPPLRHEEDRLALIEGLRDGTLSAICSDHAPHAKDAKLAPFPDTEPGISGLDSFLPLLLRLVETSSLSLNDVLSLVSNKAASVLSMDRGHLSVGSVADITLFDPEVEWALTAETMHSAGKNSPYLNQTMRGRSEATFIAGRRVS